MAFDEKWAKNLLGKFFHKGDDMPTGERKKLNNKQKAKRKRLNKISKLSRRDNR